MKNFLNKPITWNAYFKLCGLTAGTYCVFIAVICVWEKWKEHKELEEMKKANQEEYEI